MDHIALLRILKFLPGIIAGLTVHEFSHAYIAKKCGDLTSHEQGRVTLNPFRHIDLLGFIMLLVAGFGWAKPVQFNEANLRNPRLDTIKIAVAGPISNALLATVLSFIYVLFESYFSLNYSPAIRLTEEILRYAIYINWGLFVFNLIPLPPLDGSHLLVNFFRKFPAFYEGFFKYGSYIFFGLIIFTFVLKINLLPVWPVAQFLGDTILFLFNHLVP